LRFLPYFGKNLACEAIANAKCKNKNVKRQRKIKKEIRVAVTVTKPVSFEGYGI
jgi:hypothetical protein